ncbi:MAG: hypothetical protein WBM98_00260 [Maribacter sp.]|uniref:hypothetical protein n=1 Tax=Maribacter sp. TaxID=1897614 RepID=UPI003C771727
MPSSLPPIAVLFPEEEYPCLYNLEKSLDLFHLGNIEKIVSQKIRLHLYKGLTSISGQLIGKTTMGQFAAYQYKGTLRIIDRLLSIWRLPAPPFT